VRILIVTHYFPPEIGAPQARLSSLARTWAADGDEVTVLTGMPNHPTGIVPAEYRHRIRVEELVDGHRVVRTWLYATPNEGILRKTLGHLSFMLTGPLLGGRRVRPADVVMVSSPTFFSIFSAWWLARRRRARLVIDVRDLWPAIFVELGVLTNRLIIRFLERIEMRLYHASDAVVVVSEGFRDDLVRRGVPSAKVHTIRNGVDLERFHPTRDDEVVTRIRDELGVRPGETFVLYLGTHGLSQGLDNVLDAAHKLAGEPIRFVLVGEGARKAGLVRRAAEIGLTNVTFAPSVPHQAVPDLLSAADLCLVTLRDVPLFSTFIPSKMFEYLGAGRAVVGALRGESADLLRDAGGVVVAPDDPSALAEAIRSVTSDAHQRAEMERAARAHAEAQFGRAPLARRYRRILLDLVRPQASR
jgi:glycosyltransferase involved in cell wall biosynthesis